ncbi:MAG: hypothetical protein ACP5NV_06380 [Candidatus Woesearchaeota archaeon]
MNKDTLDMVVERIDYLISSKLSNSYISPAGKLVDSLVIGPNEYVSSLNSDLANNTQKDIIKQYILTLATSQYRARFEPEIVRRDFEKREELKNKNIQYKNNDYLNILYAGVFAFAGYGISKLFGGSDTFSVAFGVISGAVGYVLSKSILPRLNSTSIDSEIIGKPAYERKLKNELYAKIWDAQ